MSDMGIMVISEDDLDDLLGGSDDYIPSGMVSGRNIKTGCYGLFLIALGREPLIPAEDAQLLAYCSMNIEDIDNDTMFYSMAIHYPPDDIEYDGIIKLAEAVKVIHTVAGTIKAEDMPEDKIVLINEKLMSILGVNQHMVDIMNELEEEDV